MDFDYQMIKDKESRQREERISSLPVLQPRPVPRPSTASEDSSNIQKPPIKPRRSIKCRPVTPPGSGQTHSQANQRKNEERKRIAPSQVLNPTGPLDAQTPSLQAHNLLWFQRTQLPRLPKPVPSWLHGFTTRREAEQLLQDKQRGCFLLRLSESKVGFVLSYRGADKCRHFIIEEEDDVSGMEAQYMIAGENSSHSSLEELINYYTHNPVGPFNETLTVPCMQLMVSSYMEMSTVTSRHLPLHCFTVQDEVSVLDCDLTSGSSPRPTRRSSHERSNGICEDKAKLEAVEERADAPPASREPPATGSMGHDAHAAQYCPVPCCTAQYAAVKKALKKAHSISECLSESHMPPPVQQNTARGTETENDPPEPALGAGACGDVAHPVDAPYARVNKPQRQAQPSSMFDTDAGGYDASAANDSQSFFNDAVIAEQKYWELEPMHTYEEALHGRPHDDRIDFYAVGRHRDNDRDADFPANHVYSEVNIKGTRDDPISASPPSTRPVPRLPLRTAPRPAHAPARPESNTQNSGVLASRTPPPYPPENSEFSIYEQIPERPNKPRPPLPPLNPKR